MKAESNQIQVPHPYFKPRPYQLKVLQALDRGCKRAILNWTRRGGKDCNCWAYMVKSACQKPGNYYYLFPTYQQGKKALWEGSTKDGFRYLHFIPEQLICGKNNQEMKIELINGSIIRIMGTDEVDTIRGIGGAGIVFSEFSEQDPYAYDVIRPVLAESEGWLLINGTPKGKNHFYKLIMKVKNNPTWMVSTVQSLWPDKENYCGIDPKTGEGYIKQSQIKEDREAGMSEDMIEQEYGVSFTAGVQGTYYLDQLKAATDEGRIGHYPHDPSLPVDTFWDIGIDDPTAIWFRQIKGNRVIFIDYHEETGKDPRHFVEILANKNYTYGTHYLPWDGNSRSVQTGVTMRSMLEYYLNNARLGDDVQCATKVGKVITGINLVRARFHRYHFDDLHCQDALDKLALYHKKYDSKRQIYLKDPVHDWTSHCADALRTEATAEDGGYDEFYDNNNINIRNNTDFDPFGAQHDGKFSREEYLRKIRRFD